MLRSLDILTFIKRCKHISGVEINEESFHRQAPKTSFEDFEKKAKSRNIKFDLTREDGRRYFCDYCHYCKYPLCMGMDRKDSDLGYTLDNVVSCCSECNIMKKEIHIDIFLDICRKIANKYPILPIYDGESINKSRNRFNRPELDQEIKITQKIINAISPIPSHPIVRTYEKEQIFQKTVV
jgi:hypothetical protein